MKQANFATFTVITFLFVLAWTGFSIYHVMITSTISPLLQQEITPINGTFDQKTISAITKRLTVQPLYQIQATPTPTPSPSPVPSITPSGTQTIVTTPAIRGGGTP